MRYNSPTLQVQQLATTLQLAAPLGEIVRRVSMASFGPEEKPEEGTQMTGNRTDEKTSTSHLEVKS